MNKLKVFILLLSTLVLVSCKKLIEVPPPGNALTSDNVYADDATATAVVINIYTGLAAGSISIHTSAVNTIPLSAGLTADELSLYGGSSNVMTPLVQAFMNQLTAGFPNIPSSSNWYDFYSKLYAVNLALERLSLSTTVSKNVQQQLTGELKFLRGFLYFYLVNLYGEVPLTLTSDYRSNAQVSRAPMKDVYDQIIKDLMEAAALLAVHYVAADSKSSTSEKIRVNKWAATALLARAYLYAGDWANAEAQSSSVINNATYQLDSLNNVFLKNSAEAIWQLQPVAPGWNTWEAYVFVLPATGPTANSTSQGNPVYMSDHLVNSFEEHDNRKQKWVNSVTINTPSGTGIYFYPHKYKSATLNAPVTEYKMVLRLAEQYLIRAEARAQQNKVADAKSDLDVIRKRAGLVNTTAGDQQSLLDSIFHERQVELFTEWGHRWMDLKRTGRIDQVMSNVAPTKGTTWNKNWQWWPIPQYEITQNPRLVQNLGY